MHQYQRLASALFAAFSLMALAACATPAQLSLDDITGIRAGQQAAILMAYNPPGYEMPTARATFVNMTTAATYDLQVNGANALVAAAPDLIAVPPGRYRILRGERAAANSIGTFPLMAQWFDEFEVRPGEVVDIGTLNVEEIEVRSMQGLGDSLINALATWDPARRDTYLAYSFDYSSEVEVQRMLASKYPTLAIAPVRRSPRLLLDRTRFEQIIREAYAPNLDGSLPSTPEAQGRISSAMLAYLRESRAVAKAGANADR